MASWGVELDREAHGQARGGLLPRLGMLDAAPRGPMGSTRWCGVGLRTSSSKKSALVGVGDWIDGVHQVICCKHLLTATDKAGYATGSARRRSRPRTRPVNVSPDSEMAIAVRRYFQENGYPPLTDEQRRAVVFFEGIRPRSA